MTLDRFKRPISYVRISVTDRCNLRCTYCMSGKNIQYMQRSDILTFEEIYNFVKHVVPLGISKVRLTGGEPLVRKGIVQLIEMIASVPGITDLAMTTNGVLLHSMAHMLKNAGLQRVNISLDTLNARKFKEVTGGNVEDVIKGIKTAINIFSQVKINAVYFENSSGEEKEKLISFCREKNIELRFIHQMNLKTGEFSIVEGGEGGNCKQCNRIRLTANGMLKPCLFSDLEYSIRELGIEKALELTLQNKPKCGTKSTKNDFFAIGG